MSDDRRKKNIVELTRNEAATHYASMPKRRLTVVTDSVRSLLNIGSVFRTADAFLVERILLCGISGTPPHPEISKTALGAEENVSWQHCDDALAACRDLQREGYRICVLEQTHNSTLLGDFEPDPQGKYALVIGNEVDGVDQRIVDMADHLLEIPQWGMKHSLNVAVSTGIALWHIVRRLPIPDNS